MLQADQILQERYQLKQKLGQNAGRQTWLAADLLAIPTEPVVIKLLTFGGDVQWDDLKLFEREAKVLKQLNHPYIPRYRDYFSIDDRTLWFGLVQDYIPGDSLKHLLTQGKRFTETEVRKIAVAVLKILIYLHELNPPVLHRDIKPSNLIWGQDDEVYLVDFGAVQDRAAAEGATFTVVGTYGYAPLEQFGGRTVPASDLYALGATLVHLLTGVAPADLPQSDLTIEFRDRTNANAHLLNWIEKLLEPSLKRRFSQAQEALDALDTGHLVSFGSRTIASPKNTQIKVQKSKQQLVIELPAIKSRSSNSSVRRSSLGRFGLWVKAITLLVVGSALLQTFLAPIVFLAVAGFIFHQLKLTFGREKITLDQQKFLIERFLFNFPIRQHQGSIAEIQDVFQSLQIKAYGSLDMTYSKAKEIITIQAQTQRYSFGLGLSAVECAWVAQEIKSWLKG